MLEFTRFVGPLRIRLTLPEDQACDAWNQGVTDAAGDDYHLSAGDGVVRVPAVLDG